jgi:rSAM/selenodomain-associated transferase 2
LPLFIINLVKIGTMKISIIVPAFNEEKAIPALAESIKRIEAENFDYEIIIADGSSEDRTIGLVMDLGWQVVHARRGRGTQMNQGAQASTGQALIFLHADTHLPPGAIRQIENSLANSAVIGGNFSLLFSGSSREARWLTRIYPYLRLGGMCYGDSGFFIRREVFDAVGGFRDYPIFEDCDLYRRMRSHGRFVRLEESATTSSRRFEGRFFRTLALWIFLQVLYWLGVSPRRLGDLYRARR